MCDSGGGRVRHTVVHCGGLQKKVDFGSKDEAQVHKDEDGDLFDSSKMHIVERINVTFTTDKPSAAGVTVNARLLLIRWDNPPAPLSGTIHHAIGYEVDHFPAGTVMTNVLTLDADVPNNVTDGFRIVHYDLDYPVRIFPN